MRSDSFSCGFNRDIDFVENTIKRIGFGTAP